MPTVGWFDDDDEDPESYAQSLLSQLTRDRLIESGVQESEIENNPDLDFLNPPLGGRLMKQIGRDLRIISEEFARSSERNRVLAKAQQVDIDQVNYEEFHLFLDELFSNGISRERIVVLLFFCSDIVVRAYSNPLANLKRLFDWSLRYIFDRVCSWVRNHGGWGTVLGTYGLAVSQTIFYSLASAALCVLMYKKIFND